MGAFKHCLGSGLGPAMLGPHHFIDLPGAEGRVYDEFIHACT